MDAIGRYFGAVREVLDKVERTQAEAMEQAADWFAEAVKGGNCIFAFGCSHAGLSGAGAVLPHRRPGRDQSGARTGAVPGHRSSHHDQPIGAHGGLWPDHRGQPAHAGRAT